MAVLTRQGVLGAKSRTSDASIADARLLRAGYAGLGLLLVMLAPAPVVDWNSGSAQLHSLMEVCATLLAGMVALLAGVRYAAQASDRVLLLVAAMGGAAALDGYHMLVTSSFFAALMPSVPESLIPWSWGASRTYLAAMLLLGQWMLLRRAHGTDRFAGKLTPRRLLIPVAVLTLATFAVFAFVPLGPAYQPDAVIGRPAEFLAALLFIGALQLLILNAREGYQNMDRWLLAFLVLSIGSQLLVMPFSHRVFDGAFDLAHLLKMISYALLLVGLIEDIHQALNNERHLKVQVDSLVESLRHRNAELEESNADLKQFAYVASHDLQAPLRSISGFAQLLASRYESQLDEKGRTYIQHVTVGATRMQRLIEDLLGFARVDSRGAPLVSVELSEVLDQVRDQLHADLEAQGAELCLPEVNVAVLGDAGQLRHLFQNIVSNALKYCEQTPRVKITTSRSQGRVRISIQDNGIGIAPHHHTRIFDIFQRLHGPEAYEGTGIGLALCKRIVSRHRGKIWVESEGGEGATFHVELEAG